MRAINSKCSSIPHHRFPLLVFNVLLLCLTAAALEAPLWVQRRKMERFHQNEICLRRRREELEQFGLQPLRSLVVVENQTMWLRCFDCLHPDDADELEDMWKPSPSFIGRKLQKFLKLIKDKIARARKKGKKGKVKAKDNHLAQFRWQHHSNGVWKPAHEPFVTDEPGTNEEKGKSVKNFIDEIMSKDGDEDDYEDEETKKQNKEKKKQKKEDKKRKKTMYIGDHLELEVRRLNRALHQGWFRCVRMNNDHSKVSATSQLVHVDVLDHVNVTMLKVDSDAIISSNEDDDENNIIESGSSNSRGGSTTVPDKDGSAAQRMAAVHKFSFPSAELQRWLQVYAHASDWTPCNKCGNRTGEKRRSVSCHVRLNPQMLTSIRDWNDLPKVLQIFWSFAGHLPCASSQLPQSVRAALPAELRDQVYEEFTECTSVCTVSRHGGVTRKMRSGAQQNLAAQAEEDNNKSSKNRTEEQEAREEAVIRQMEGGEVLDVLPAGEFAVSERLPPLPPPIIRKTIFATEEQPLQLDCSNQDGLALIWRKNFEELNGSRMLADERHKWIWDEEQRRQLTADGQLLIRAVRKEDSGLYSCTAFPGGHILRTFRIYFVAGDRTKELLEYMSLIFRILLFAYLLILMLDLLNVDVPNV